MKALLTLGLVLLTVPVFAQDAPVSPLLAKWNKAAIVGSLGLHTADLAITLAALQSPHLREANPLFDQWSDQPAALTLVKLGIAGLTHYLLWKIYHWAPRYVLVGMIAQVSVMSYVVIHNARVVHAVRR